MPTQIVNDRPVVCAIGGLNGAGKTTFAREYLPALGIEHFLNADSIAAGLSPLKPEAMAVPAARLLLRRWRELVAAQTSFAFESTFSGRTYAPMLRDVRTAGYFVQVCYLWLPSADTSLRRVRRRVLKGGHNVPPEDIRRRYLLSVRNFFELYLPLSMLRCCTGLRMVRRSWWHGGRALLRKWCNRRFMKESTSKPLRDPILDAFTEAATKAMWRAHRAAVKEDARYGLTPVLERPRRAAKKK